jgi:hypothetical protein
MMPAPGASLSYMFQRGQRRDFQERRAGVEQHLHALARQQLAARQVCLARAASPPPKSAARVLRK